MANFNEDWGFDFGGKVKTYGYTAQQVQGALDSQAKNDFNAANKRYQAGKAMPSHWAALQAGYHIYSQFMSVRSGDRANMKISSMEYFKTKSAILSAAGVE